VEEQGDEMKHEEGSKAWAIAQMLNGKKVTHMGCKTGEYFYMGSCGTLWDESDDCFDINIEVATGWSIVEEPKTEEYLYLWRWKDSNGDWFESNFWRTENGAAKDYGDFTHQKRSAPHIDCDGELVAVSDV